jgi:hypothetical protein
MKPVRTALYVCIASVGLLAQALCQSHSFGPMPLYGPPAPASPTGPTVEVTLSKPFYHIRIDPQTGAPIMPTDVTATARAVQWPAGTPRPTVFTWRVLLDWDYKPYPTTCSLDDRTWTQANPLHVDFGNEIRGGTLTVFARTELNGRLISGKVHAMVLGDNPSRSQILKAFPRNRFGLIASKIGMAESGLCQFTAPNGTDPGGMPEVSPTNDVGIMQLNAPTGSIDSPDQIWDWRANIRQGLAVLEGKQRTTRLAFRSATTSDRTPLTGLQQLACLNLFRASIGLNALSAPAIPALSEQPGSGTSPDDPDVDHVKLSQFERDAIRRYNGGSEYAYALLLAPNWPIIQKACWTIDPTRGGINPKRGDPDYVRHVLAAHSGFTLAEPPKPVSHLPHHRRRRKRVASQ